VWVVGLSVEWLRFFDLDTSAADSWKLLGLC